MNEFELFINCNFHGKLTASEIALAKRFFLAGLETANTAVTNAQTLDEAKTKMFDVICNNSN